MRRCPVALFRKDVDDPMHLRQTQLYIGTLNRIRSDRSRRRNETAPRDREVVGDGEQRNKCYSLVVGVIRGIGSQSVVFLQMLDVLRKCHMKTYHVAARICPGISRLGRVSMAAPRSSTAAQRKHGRWGGAYTLCTTPYSLGPWRTNFNCSASSQGGRVDRAIREVTRALINGYKEAINRPAVHWPTTISWPGRWRPSDLS